MNFKFFKEILSNEEVKTIKEHTYKTTGYSWLDYKLNPFWEFIAKKLPYVSNKKNTIKHNLL
jgi:hypothetical protein